MNRAAANAMSYPDDDQTPLQSSSAHRTDGRFAFDARNHRVRLLDPVVLHLTRRDQPIPPGPLRAIACDIDAHWTRRHVVPTLIALLAGVAIVLGYIALRPGLATGSRFVAGFNVICPMFFIVYGWKQSRRKAQPRVLPALLKHLRCPHCGYDLRGLDADPADGATVCPECGCAWNLGDPAIAALPPPEQPALARQRGATIALLIGLVVFAAFGVWMYFSY